MDKFLSLTSDEIKMAFVASCIENVAERLSLPYSQAFERLEKAGLIDNYLFGCYNTLHTEDRNNLTVEIISALQRRENMAE